MPTQATNSRSLAEAIADQLGETDLGPVAQIVRTVRVLGEERALALLAETLAIEARGGEMLADGSRRRTPGGVYFRLVRGAATWREKALIFPDRATGGQERPAPFTWDVFGTIAPGLREGAGEATTVKITVIGRPKQVRAQGDVILVPLVSEKLPTIPKGLPTPATGTAYAVLIAKKQWQKVAEALKAPDDRLIIEGYPTLDARFQGITVLATNVTTTGLQAAKREQQRAATQQ